MIKPSYHLTIYSSVPDSFGNSYVAMEVMQEPGRKSAVGTISGGPSNCKSALKQLTGGEWGNFTYDEFTLPIREWDRLFTHAPYLGCTPDEINPNIMKQLNNKEG